MGNERKLRLIQVAKEFKVGLNTVTDFLQKKGIKSDGSPNTLVDAETYALLEKEFGAGRAVNSERVNIRERIAQKQATVTLDDGTQVWLNSESSLVFPVRFGDGPREVTVTGEAYFDVAHDASRRFVVHADTVSVSVYGTAFNISSYADEGAIETTLVRGSVEVRSGHRRAMLQPGQQARVGREGAIFDVRQVAAEDYAAWTRGLFTFNDETIASICRKLSRWYGVEIVPRGVDADKVRYTGVVKRYETFAEMARLLARTDQIRADVEEGKIVLCIDRDDD